MMDAITALLPSMLSSAAIGTDDASTGDTSDTSTVDGSSGSSSADSTSVGGLSSDSFLQLLVSQLTNQDPMNPTDSTTYITEESEFSMVQSMNQVSAQMASMFSNESMQQATDLIGKNVTYTDSNGDAAAATDPASTTDPTTDTTGTGSTDSTTGTTSDPAPTSS
jgi:flagellar basal-body rod modification protein FlgD